MVAESKKMTDLMQGAHKLRSQCMVDDANDSDRDNMSDLPRIRRNLAQIVSASQQLNDKAKPASGRHESDIQASILLGSQGVDLPSLQTKISSLGQRVEERDELRSQPGAPSNVDNIADVATFLRTSQERALLSLIESCRTKTAESVANFVANRTSQTWQREKRRILTAFENGYAKALSDVVNNKTPCPTSPTLLSSSTKRSKLTATELMFAKDVETVLLASSAHSVGDSKMDLLTQFETSVAKASLVLDEVQQLWHMVVEVTSNCSKPSSPESLVASAVRYLEAHFARHMSDSVRDAGYPLGGRPGLEPVVRGYLRVKFSSSLSSNGDVVSILPWTAVYYCLRAGSAKQALDCANCALSTAANDPDLTAIGGQSVVCDLENLVGYLQEYADSSDDKCKRALGDKSSSQVRLDYKRLVSLQQQRTVPLDVSHIETAFRKAVLCILTKGQADPLNEHSESVATSLDDYLWFKLSYISASEKTDGLISFQSTVTEEYGEDYFAASDQPTLYFQVLFLSGQPELAVEYLFRSRWREHGLHLAMALHRAGIIRGQQSKSVDMPMLMEDAGGVKRVNLERMLVMYVAPLTMDEVDGSDQMELVILYYSYIRQIAGSADLFVQMVVDLILSVRGERRMKRIRRLFGHYAKLYDKQASSTVQPLKRIKGLVDGIVGQAVEVDAIMNAVAAELEDKGVTEEAVTFYDLASNASRCLQLTTVLLSRYLDSPKSDSNRAEVHTLAEHVAIKYKSIPDESDETVRARSTLYLMLDIITFFDLMHDLKYVEALNVLDRIRILPATPAEVDSRVSMLRQQYNLHIRNCLPALLIAVTDCIRGLKSGPSSSVPGDGMLRSRAKALVAFAGSMPHHMPTAVNSQLIQMERMFV